jgi:hypothetical protein
MGEVLRVWRKFFELFLIYKRNQRLGLINDNGAAGVYPRSAPPARFVTVGAERKCSAAVEE